MSFAVQMTCLLAGLIADAIVIGDPDVSCGAGCRTPSFLIGKAIDRLDALLNREEDAARPSPCQRV